MKARKIIWKYKIIFQPIIAFFHCQTESNVQLCPNLRKFVSEKHMVSKEEVEKAVNEYVYNLPDSHFRKGILMFGYTLDQVF